MRYEVSCELPEGAFELTPVELARRLGAGEPITLLDVRTPREREVASLPGELWIPLRELPERWSEVPADRPVVVYCHGGGRSAQATMYLREAGRERVYNLAGGIDRWSREVDPSVPRY